MWSAPRAPQQLKKDSSLIYIAQNAARHSESPLEPLFRAVFISNPSFDIRSVDVVTDRNNIRKFLSFIDPSLTKNGHEPFTINIEVGRNTAMFSLAETATHEFIKPREFRGFDHEFEKAYTNSQIKGSTGHYRVISYRFGDLKYLVRHETDGYVDAGTWTLSSNRKDSENNRLSSMLGFLSLFPTQSPLKVTCPGSELTIQEEGELVPLESTLEMKTRVKHKRLEIQEVAPQLWVSQTFKLVRAYHHKGIFEKPEVEDVAAPIKEWEERNQMDLGKLAGLITKIVEVVKGSGENAIVRYDAGEDKLVFRKVDERTMLPNDLYTKWADKENSEAQTNMEYNAESRSAVKPFDGAETKANGKSVVFDPKGTKGKEAAEAAEKGEQNIA